jgi:NTP pyrophosphatase (non-canonical NTP hydrolase)
VSDLGAAYPDLSLRELSEWATGQAKRLAANFNLDPEAETDRAFFALAQATKLGEEVGELHAEVLGAVRYHRADKAGRYTADTLGGELADVTVCLALLARILDIDLAAAVGEKIGHLNARTYINSPAEAVPAGRV